MPNFGKIYMIPCTLGDVCIDDVIPGKTADVARGLQYFIVEDIRTSRRYLSKLKMPVPIDELHFSELNEHTAESDISSLLKPALQGYDIGLISDAGVPGVADPGAAVAACAHACGITVVPLVGPSSIILAMMAAGMNGQNFAFAGYLPVKEPERSKRIRTLETRSRQEKQTQVFIEAPYRNAKLFETFINTCSPETRLCIAANITLADEFIQTHTIADWKKHKPEINKKPCIFVMQG